VIELPNKVVFLAPSQFYQIACPIGHYPVAQMKTKCTGYLFSRYHINQLIFPGIQTSNPIAFPACLSKTWYFEHLKYIFPAVKLI
jgi:hypothetical protein